MTRSVLRMRALLAAAVALSALCSPLPAQTPAQYQAAVDAAYSKYKGPKEGKNADYIPALAKVNPAPAGREARSTTWVP